MNLPICCVKHIKSSNLLNILNLSKKVLNDDNLDIEVEYQSETIGKYDLDFSDNTFQLIAKQTDCLTKIKCNIPQSKQKLRFSESLVTNQTTCTPGGGCC